MANSHMYPIYDSDSVMFKPIEVAAAQSLRGAVEQIANDVADIKLRLHGVSQGGIIIPTARDIAALAKTRKG